MKTNIKQRQYLSSICPRFVASIFTCGRNEAKFWLGRISCEACLGLVLIFILLCLIYFISCILLLMQRHMKGNRTDFLISHNISCLAMKPAKPTFPPWQPSSSKALQGAIKQCLVVNWVKTSHFPSSSNKVEKELSMHTCIWVHLDFSHNLC